MKSVSIVILTFVSAFFLFFLGISCSSITVTNNTHLFPDFIVQKSYYLNQFPVDFTPIFNIKNSAGEKIYKIHKKLKLTKNEFVIEDIKHNKKYILKEDLTNDEKQISYKVINNANTLFSITQKDSKLTFKYNNSLYTIKEQINKNKAKGIKSILFIIKNNDKEVGFIYKKVKFFLNQYLIVINKKDQQIKDQFFIIISVFLDQQLTEQGYKYK